MNEYEEEDARRVILVKRSDDGETWIPVTDPAAALVAALTELLGA